MNTTTKSSFPTIMAGAGRLALQWRLLVLWIGALLIPNALLTVPLWQIFSTQLDHTLHASELAHHLTMNAANDLMTSVVTDGALLKPAGLLALIVTLLLSPFLSGVAIAVARAKVHGEPRLSFGGLVHGGIGEYWRMLRMLLLAVVPLGIAGGIGGALMNLADKYALHAILRSDADLAAHAATVATVLLLLLALATVDAGRAQFALSLKRRSAIMAWGRGCKLLFKRPLGSIGSYFVLTIVGVVVVVVMGLLRINVSHVEIPGFVLGLALTQLAAAAMAWMRSSRLFAMIDLARQEAPV